MYWYLRVPYSIFCTSNCSKSVLFHLKCLHDKTLFEGEQFYGLGPGLGASIGPSLDTSPGPGSVLGPNLGPR